MPDPVPYAPAVPGGIKPFQPQPPVPGAAPTLQPNNQFTLPEPDYAAAGKNYVQSKYDPLAGFGQAFGKPLTTGNASSGASTFGLRPGGSDGVIGRYDSTPPPLPQWGGLTPPAAKNPLLQSPLQPPSELAKSFVPGAAEGRSPGTGGDPEFGSPNLEELEMRPWMKSLKAVTLGELGKGFGIFNRVNNSLPDSMTFDNIERGMRTLPFDVARQLTEPIDRTSAAMQGRPYQPTVDLSPETLETVSGSSSPAPVSNALGLEGQKIQLSDIATVAAGAPKALQLLGAGAKRLPGIVGTASKLDPVTGAGAVRNFTGGLIDMGKGLTGKGLQGTATRGGTFGQGAIRTFGIAPTQTMVPSALAGVAAQTRPGAADETANKYIAPGGAGAGPGPNNIVAPWAVLGKTFGVLPEKYDQAGIPTVGQVVGTQLKNLANAGDLAVKNWPAFRRAGGDAVNDLGHNLEKGFDAGPEKAYRSLTESYLANKKLAPNPAFSALGGGLISEGSPSFNENIRNQVAGLDYSTPRGPEFARMGLLRDEVDRRLQDQGLAGLSGDQSRGVSAYADTVAPRQIPDDQFEGSGLPYPTARDTRDARVLAGLEPDGNRDRNSAAFNRSVDEAMSKFPGGSAAGLIQSARTQGQQPQQTPAGPTALAPESPSPIEQAPAPRESKYDPQTAAQVHKIIAGTMLMPELAVGGAAMASGAAGEAASRAIGSTGKAITGLLSKTGNLTNALQAAKQAPDPSAFSAAIGVPAAVAAQGGDPSSAGTSELSKYWNELPSSSRILAVAGLSLTAISALRSMFSSGDDDDESFLSKVLPYLGIAGAAWGLGGGTIGLSRENLPSVANYKRLGNAVTGSLGMGRMLN